MLKSVSRTSVFILFQLLCIEFRNARFGNIRDSFLTFKEGTFTQRIFHQEGTKHGPRTNPNMTSSFTCNRLNGPTLFLLLPNLLRNFFMLLDSCLHSILDLRQFCNVFQASQNSIIAYTPSFDMYRIATDIKLIGLANMEFTLMSLGLACLFLLGFLIAYLILVSNLRFRRIRQQEAFYTTLYPTVDSLARMTNEDAHEIVKNLQQYEFPFAFEASLAASLYRPYGIPSISKVLNKTKQFSNVCLASKRTADTAVLVVDLGQNPPESEKCCGAIARTNYIHGVYQKAGLIKDEDLLYTLALLAWLPIRFIERYEWRSLTTTEAMAAGVFWKSLGDAMNLSYAPLPSAPPNDGVTPRSAGSWKSGLHFLGELRDWSERYERESMVPHELNHKAAIGTERILLYGLPRCFTGVGRQGLSAVMDDRLREALILSKPSWIISTIVLGVLQLRKFLLRHLYLPRFKPHIRVTQAPDAFGRFHRTTWAAQPWYVKGTFTKRWRWQAWKEWACGRPIPGDASVQPQGYIQEEVGPNRFRGKGLKEFEEEKERLMNMRRGGCPFG